jgi:antirestriction protein ArdC
MLHAMSYEWPFWLTFKQAKEMGGNVRRGEHACPVVFWKWLDADDASEPTGKRRVPMLRYYSVFNVAQCDGVTAQAIEGTDREHNPIETAEQIVAAMPQRPVIRHGLDRAFYSPAADSVGMPSPERFETRENCYNVLFHELTHSTGHESRRNRKGVSGVSGERAAFGTQSYSKEELGDAFLCGRARIMERTIENSAAYARSWLERLKDDARLVVQAAAQAQKAAVFILGAPEREAAAP